jgi:c-di-GMP-binding flagellar brake protein YcgR
MSIFKQKRRNSRQALQYYLEVFERDSTQAIGRTIDISTAGIQLVSEKPLEIGKAYELMLKLPEEVQEASEVFFICHCVRHYKDRHSGYYYSGLQFKDQNPEYLPIIELLISDYGF